MAFDRVINLTLGLPFARTCRDRSTAFDITAVGIAAQSTIAAIVDLLN